MGGGMARTWSASEQAIRCSGMNQVQGLAASTAIDAEIPKVGRDDFRSGKSLGELQHATIGHVHLRPIFQNRRANGFRLTPKNGFDSNPALSGQREHEVNGALGVGENVARFGQHNFAGDGDFSQRIQHFSGPRVMLVRRVGECDQRTRIENVAWTSHARNPLAQRGYSDQSSRRRVRGRNRSTVLLSFPWPVGEEILPPVSDAPWNRST